MFDIKKTKAVLWDLDDTLYSRKDAARLTFPGMFKKLLYTGRSDTKIEEMADFMMTKVKRNSMIHEDAFDALFEKYPSDKPYNRADCLDYYYEYISDFAKPFPDVINVIEKLKNAGIKTAIVTNITSDRLYSQRKKVMSLGIQHLFDTVIYSGEIGIHKPDRRIFDYTAKLLGVSNEQCVFVGDDPDSDVTGALNANMEAVWIDRLGDEGRFAGDFRVHRIKSVYEYFNL